jgi:hypothetical protein
MTKTNAAVLAALSLASPALAKSDCRLDAHMAYVTALQRLASEEQRLMADRIALGDAADIMRCTADVRDRMLDRAEDAKRSLVVRPVTTPPRRSTPRRTPSLHAHRSS